MAPEKTIRIGLIGDFDYSFNGHHATNLAIDHVSNQLDITIDYFWIRTHEALDSNLTSISSYDGIWIPPNFSKNPFHQKLICEKILDSHLPFIITGEGYQSLIHTLVKRYKINTHKEKCISSNLHNSKKFEVRVVRPLSKELKKIYVDKEREELTATLFSIYPRVRKALEDTVIDVEAVNNFDEPEIISLKHRSFALATAHLPQICSKNDFPHPLIMAFFNYLRNKKK